MIQSLEAAFSAASDALLVPVLLSLVIAGIAVVLMLGQTCRAFLDRLLYSPAWRRVMQALDRKGVLAADWRKHAKYGVLEWFARVSPAKITDENAQRLLGEAEYLASVRLSKFQVLLRVGPMLGLVGTLIPLGPALQSVASSDLASAGRNLSIAFTSTIFGIIIASVAYALHRLHRNWFERDLLDLEHITAAMKARNAHVEEVATLGP